LEANFREQLTTVAAESGWRLQIEWSCSSFTQAAGVVKTEAFDAALPNLAAVEFSPGEVVQFPLPFLKSYARPICVAWKPRLGKVRLVVEQAVEALRQT
jgi:hypothetical protein